MDKNIAISVQNVSKTFKIPHEKISSLRGAAINVFKKKSYEEFQALDDVSFEVKKGEFFGIIGRNGSGKSTLLKVLAGIYQPDQGSVVIDRPHFAIFGAGHRLQPRTFWAGIMSISIRWLGMTNLSV